MTDEEFVRAELSRCVTAAMDLLDRGRDGDACQMLAHASRVAEEGRYWQ